MEKIAFRNAIKLAVAATLISLLCACATKPAPEKSVRAPSAVPSENNPVSKNVESTAFKSQQLLKPNEIIEKDKLRVSYSMKVIPDETGYLVQISMVFRNKKDQSVNLSPKITLSDSKEAVLRAYSKKSFLKFASRKTGAAASKDNGLTVNRSAAEDKIKWANSYWLKEHFSVPSNGIEIGELVYHCTTLNLPMKLTVNSAGQNFIFNLSDTSSTTGSQ